MWVLDIEFFLQWPTEKGSLDVILPDYHVFSNANTSSLCIWMHTSRDFSEGSGGVAGRSCSFCDTVCTNSISHGTCGDSKSQLHFVCATCASVSDKGGPYIVARSASFPSAYVATYTFYPNGQNLFHSS